MRLLLIEDEPGLARHLERGLTEEGYAVDRAGTAAIARERLAAVDYDLIVLDLMLPDGHGLDLLESYRRDEGEAPVLVLTARDAVSDTVIGLDTGADDYMTKPFSFDELLARLRSLGRRRAEPLADRLVHGDLVLDRTRRQVSRSGWPVPLTLKEYCLLELFMLHPEVALDRQRIAEHVWSGEEEPRTNVIDVLVGRLRRKIEHGMDGTRRPRLLQTVTGVGYALRPADPSADSSAPSAPAASDREPA